MNTADRHVTIVAAATPSGRGGIGIVRLSGPRAHAIAAALTGTTPRHGSTQRARWNATDGTILDDGLMISFRSPRSFTGEDVVELHGHGNPLLLGRTIEACVAHGARRARPGEFSERAFLNGKLDLTRAEAIADLIAAGSDAQLRAARRSLDGAFAQRVDTLLAALIALRVQVEAAIDFPDEDIDPAADPRLAADLDALLAAHTALLAEARRGRRLRDGLAVAIIGRPNVGKSTLLNALAGTDRAIVTPLPGTTRDTLVETIVLDGSELTLVDTAGLRDTDDPIEAEGMRRARAELARADLALIMLAPDDPPDTLEALRAECPAGCRRVILHNKVDLLAGRAVAGVAASASVGSVSQPNHAADKARTHAPTLETHLVISARNGSGLDELRALLHAESGALEAAAGAFSARARHVDALERVHVHLDDARAGLAAAAPTELIAEDLRLAQQALSEITGVYTADDLLGAVFGTFCIGK
jgi:tRNA modification GTPase